MASVQKHETRSDHFERLLNFRDIGQTTNGCTGQK